MTTAPPTPMTPPDSDPYLTGLRRRARATAAAHSAWRDRRWAEVRAVVPVQRDRFGVQRVVVFGSLARERAKPGSDVDLLVYGLQDADFLDAVAVARHHLQHCEVDLVPDRWCRPEVRARAEAEGVVVDG